MGVWVLGCIVVAYRHIAYKSIVILLGSDQDQSIGSVQDRSIVGLLGSLQEKSIVILLGSDQDQSIGSVLFCLNLTF